MTDEEFEMKISELKCDLRREQLISWLTGIAAILLYHWIKG